MASHFLLVISVNCGFLLMGCEQVNWNLTPLYFVTLSGFKLQALTILLKLRTSPLFGLSYKLAYGFLTSLSGTIESHRFSDLLPRHPGGYAERTYLVICYPVLLVVMLSEQI